MPANCLNKSELCHYMYNGHFILGRRCPSINDRQVLPYTEACIYETMRSGVTVGLAQPHLTMCNTQVGKGYHSNKTKRN